MVHTIDIDDIKLSCKIWFTDIDDEHSLLGENKISLLEALQNEGSIKAAAEKCNIEYKRAWDMIHTINEKFAPNTIIVSERGKDGGSSLTTLGIELLQKYKRIDSIIQTTINILNQGKDIEIVEK